MPEVSQNHDGSPKRRLQPIIPLDEPLGNKRVRGVCARARAAAPRARSAQLVRHAVPTEIQYLRVYSTGIQSVILLLPRKSQ